jgi:N,N'-diacetyllegionaminate synthase
MPVTIIAEAGISHGGSLAVAQRLVDHAKEAAADIVKFQTYDPDALLHEHDPSKPLLKSLALDRRKFLKLARHCEKTDIEFMSTPGDLDSLKFLVEECGVGRIKIGSDDLTYEPLVSAAYATGLPVLLSTGLSTLEEVRHALPAVPVSSLTLLQCTSCYPTRLTDVNLRAMDALRTLGWPVGYSDHTGHTRACLAAVARDATVIEKHFAPMGYMGPDCEVSVLPHVFGWMVEAIRDIEKMLGSGIKEPCADELANIPKFRKGKDGKRIP